MSPGCWHFGLLVFVDSPQIISVFLRAFVLLIISRYFRHFGCVKFLRKLQKLMKPLDCLCIEVFTFGEMLNKSNSFITTNAVYIPQPTFEGRNSIRYYQCHDIYVVRTVNFVTFCCKTCCVAL